MSTTRPLFPAVDLLPELADLLVYFGKVGASARMYSTYTGAHPHPNDRKDMLWVSDHVHNMGQLGRAIAAHDPTEILSACSWLIRGFEEVLNTPAAREACERARLHPEIGLAPLKSIQAKVQAFMDESHSTA